MNLLFRITCLSILISLCSTISFADDRSIEIWRRIDELEKQKPFLQGLADYSKEQMPIAKQTRKDVKKYSESMQNVMQNNNIKTMMSGALNISVELATAGNAGKLTDLGAWVAGKGIGIAMDKSSTFGGQAYYNKKIEGISSVNKNLTTELDKLYNVSNSSDEAIKSYYNKYGKYADTLELGDVGVFTTRMRLIVEQSEASLLSLDALSDNLIKTQDDAERDLRIIDRQLADLKKQLDDLNKENRGQIVEEPKAVGLSPAESARGNLVLADNASLDIPEIQRCTDAEEALGDVLVDGNAEFNKIVPLVESLNAERNKYVTKIKTELETIDNDFSKSLCFGPDALGGDAIDHVKQGVYPTGKPFSEFLAATEKSNTCYVQAKKAQIPALKKLAEQMVENLPDELLLHEVAQVFTNLNKLKKAYIDIGMGCSTLSEQTLAALRASENSPGFLGLWPEIIDYPRIVKDLKIGLLQRIDKEESGLDLHYSWHTKQMSELASYFERRRSEMFEEIAAYEAALAKKEKYEKDLLTLMNQLQSLYTHGPFTVVDGNGFRNYQLNVNMHVNDAANICATVKELQTRITSGELLEIIALEKKKNLLLSFSGIYSTGSFPLDAYIEHSMDFKKIQAERDAHASRYLTAAKADNNSSSNLQTVSELFFNNKLFQLSQFYPKSVFAELYAKQTTSANGIKNLQKNLKVEIENTLPLEKIPESRHEDLNEFYTNLLKNFRDNLGCLPLDNQLITGIAEEFDEIKKLLPLVKSKPTYLDAKTLIKNVTDLYKKVDVFYIDNSETYKSTYLELSGDYKKYYMIVNKTYVSELSITDRITLNELLVKIENLLKPHDEQKKTNTVEADRGRIEALYTTFTNAYESKNDSGLLGCLDDDWSAGDGTTLADVQDHFRNMFTVFDQIQIQMSGFQIFSTGKSGGYRVSYNLSIVGKIFADSLKHEEKSSVVEEVAIDANGRARIASTPQGRFWLVE